MGKLTFIGLGLYSRDGITILGLKKAMQARKIYVEFYTSLMPMVTLEGLKEIIGKPVSELTRHELEEHPEETVLREAEIGEVALLIPGDPLVATTHIDLCLRARRRGIETEIVNGVSIYSAAPAASGLQIYKFGKTVTVPYITANYQPETPYDVVKENTERGLHSLVLLDLNRESKSYMTIREGLEYFLTLEEKRKERVISPHRLAIAVTGIGSSTPLIKGDQIKRLLAVEFMTLPHTLIFPGKLHFMEVETLKTFCSTPEDALGTMT